ncbi:hypothetical protein [Lentzea sp. NPDC003310]
MKSVTACSRCSTGATRKCPSTDGNLLAKTIATSSRWATWCA